MLSNQIILSTLVLTFSIYGTTVMGQALPDPTSLRITEMKHDGSGCEPGTVASNLSDDGQAITLLFDSFVIETKRGRISAKNCIVEMKIDVPAGWQFAIFDVGFRGYATLDAGVRVKHNSVYKFDNNTFRDTQDSDFVGPYADDYEHYTSIPLSERTWSKCHNRPEEKKLRIRTRMALVKDPGRAARDAEGMVTVDSFDGSIVQNYKVAWQRCGNIAPIVPEVPVAPASCGANLITRAGTTIKAYHAGRDTEFRLPALAKLQCDRDKANGQRCDVVRNNCR